MKLNSLNKLASVWVCLAMIFFYCSQAVAEIEYRLFPAQPVVGQEIFIKPSTESLCTRIETKEAASLTGSTIHAVVEVRDVICPIQSGSADLIGRFIDLEAGEYQLVIDEIIYKSDGSENGRNTYSMTFEVAPDSFYISPGMTGSWYNPEESGHGVNLEFLADKRLVGYWYTFDNYGAPVWLFLNGTYTSSDARVEVLEVEGGVFPPAFDPDMITRTSWGSLEFSFTDCSHATMTWMTDNPMYSSGEMEILKLSPAIGIPCRDSTNATNEGTFVPVVRYALESENILLSEYEVGTESDWVVQHEELPEQFNVPDYLGVDTALHITGSSGKLTLLTDIPWDWNPEDPDRYVMVEFTLRLATRQTLGCALTSGISMNFYKHTPQVLPMNTDIWGNDRGYEVFELMSRGYAISENLDLGSAMLDEQPNQDCEEMPLTEMTLKSNSAQLLLSDLGTIGLHIESLGSRDNETPIDFYLIEATLRRWDIELPDSRSAVIPVSE